jgi:hypothetical protein
MTTTATSSWELRDLETGDALEYVVSCRRAADEQEAKLLAGAVHWVDLHPVTHDRPAATWRSQQPPGGILGRGDHGCEPLAGEGTPAVAEYAVEELAAALNLSYAAGLNLVSEAVELCYRLPRLWALVQSGALQAWKARQVARETTNLSRRAVDFVDRHAATTGRHNHLPPLRPLIHEARLQCDPDQAAAVEQAALDARGVWFDQRESTATTQVTATLDTLDALDLDASISDLAATMGALGDDRSLDVRRASALGMLAHPQRALDLVQGTAGSMDGTDTSVAAAAAPLSGLNGSRATLYLHITAADLAACTRSEHGGTQGGGSVERLGTATLDLLKNWLQRTQGVTVRPVLDLSRDDAVDQHDPTHAIRETVILRDRRCVFPGCTVSARRCDLDHITAYLSPDEGGPPGQTSPANLACLCRRHHRMKTFAGWTYRRTVDGYLWVSPHGRTYRVHR